MKSFIQIDIEDSSGEIILKNHIINLNHVAEINKEERKVVLAGHEYGFKITKESMAELLEKLELD